MLFCTSDWPSEYDWRGENIIYAIWALCVIWELTLAKLALLVKSSAQEALNVCPNHHFPFVNPFDLTVVYFLLDPMHLKKKFYLD